MRQDGTPVPRPQGSQEIVPYNPTSDNNMVIQTLAQLSQQSAGITPQQVSITQEELAIEPETVPAGASPAEPMAIGWSSTADALGFPRELSDVEAEIARRSAKAKFVTPPTVQGCYFRAREDMPTRPGEIPQNLCSASSAPSFGNKVCTIAPGGWFGPVLEVMVQDRGIKGLVVKVQMISDRALSRRGDRGRLTTRSRCMGEHLLRRCTVCNSGVPYGP